MTQTDRVLHSAVRVTDDPRKGRQLTATRALEPGDLVLRELPSLSWPVDQVDQMVRSFLSTGPAEQLALLNMVSPSVNADLEIIPDRAWRNTVTTARLQRAVDRHALALQLAEEYDGPRVLELIDKLLLIGDTNSQAFESGVALFPLAAMANHSCHPNCGHSTRQGGEMRYYAQRAIAAGEEVTISYLGGLWAKSSRERRSALLLEKCFFCNCDRCRAPDTCRGLRCLGAGCGGVALPQDEAGDSAGEWRCQRCGARHHDDHMPGAEAEAEAGAGAEAEAEAEAGAEAATPADVAILWRAARGRHAERLALEERLLREAAALPAAAAEVAAAAGPAAAAAAAAGSAAEAGSAVAAGSAATAAAAAAAAVAAAMAAAVDSAVSAVREQLSPTHYLAARLLDSAGTGCSGALQRLATLECAAAGCCSMDCARRSGVTGHPPCPELVGDAVSAVVWCRRDGPPSVEAARLISARYISWATVHFGAQNAFVLAMEKAMQQG